MDQLTTISNCMHHNPLTIHRDANLTQAIDTIFEHKLTGLTVTDDEGYAVGVLSELDCLDGIRCVLNDPA